MYTNFAEKVLNYFKNRMACGGQPLDETEMDIYRQAQQCAGVFPISCLSRGDLESVGYDTDGVDDRRMQLLAGKLADSYREQLYLDDLDNLAYRHGFVKRGTADIMRGEYRSLVAEGEKVTVAVGVIRYKDSGRLQQVCISLGDGSVDCFHSVKDIDALCALCDPHNRYGFYIDCLISFG